MRELTGRIADQRAAWVFLALGVGLTISLGIARFGANGGFLVLAVLAAVAVGILGLLDVRVSMSLALLTLPLDIFGRIIENPVAVTIYQLSLLLALMAWALAMIRGKKPLPRLSVVDAGMAMLVIAGIWSLPHSLAPSVTVINTIRLVFIWAFVALISNNLSSKRDLRWFTDVLLFTGVIGALVAFAQAQGVQIGNTHVQGSFAVSRLARVSGFFDDPNYFAGFLTACTVVAVGKLAHSNRFRTVVIYGAAAAICAGGVVLTFSRTAWVGLFIGLVALALTAPKRVRFVLVTLGLAGMLAVVAFQPQAFVDRLVSSFDFSGDESVSTRIYMAESMVDMIQDNPVWGTGLAAFDQEYPFYRRAYANRTIVRPHMIMLGLWAETGIAGLLAELVLVGGLIFLLFVDRRGRPFTVYESIALAGALCMSVQSMFQYYLYFEYLWVFPALAVAAVRVARAQEEESS